MHTWYSRNIEDLIVLNALLIMSVVTVVILRLCLQYRERKRIQVAVINAAEKGLVLSPEVLKVLSDGVRTSPPPLPLPRLDLRKGIVWLSFAAGLALFAFTLVVGHDPEHLYLPIKDPIAALGIAALPAAIGIGYIILWLTGRKQSL